MTSPRGQAASLFPAPSSSLVRSCNWPSMKVAPARTSATRCGAFTRRQRPCAASSSLKAIARPDSRELAPFVTGCRRRTVEFYELVDLRQAVDLAVAEHEGASLLVQQNTPPLRRDVYYEQAFLPAVEGFVPDGLGAEHPGAATATATATAD